MTQSTHRRSPSSPHTSKQKLSRPALHRRGTSAVNVSISKLGAGIGHPRASSKDDEAEVAMASFLNFCATCEKQITVPDNSLLYCSEACRTKDSCKPLSASQPTMSTSTSTTKTPPGSPPTSPRNIVTPLKPTSRTSMIQKPRSFDGSSDMDPTEWKPALRAATSLGSSDAWTYLSTFYGSEKPSRRNRSLASLPARIETEHAHMPPLSHTPSTPASSFSSASEDILLDDVLTLTDTKRPSPKTKSIDLVTPLDTSIPVVVVNSPDAWVDREHAHSAPIAIVRAPHARVRSA